MAILFGGLLIHGIQPGPLLIQKHPDLFWGVVMSMYLGNMMLLALNLPLIGMWVKVLKVPYTILFPLILLFCLIGVYSVNNSVIDIYVMILFGIAGYVMQKFGFEPAPLVLAYVLSPMLETALRQSLNISGGSFGIFFSRPISLTCFVIFAALIGLQVYSYYRPKKKNPSLSQSRSS
jgi:putative tricarboxylic transport membrane protein